VKRGMIQQVVFATPTFFRMDMAAMKKNCCHSQDGNEKRFFHNIQLLDEQNVNGKDKKGNERKRNIHDLR
jgi:hypothetical protein